MAQNIQVNSLNFDEIKSNLKGYLSNTDVFTDYDFDGSGLSAILDLLAYTTYYQGVYNNFVANEMFISTAESRAAVSSHAKSLGYTPRSQTAPTAIVNVTFGSTAGLSTTFRRGAIFTTKIDSRTYRFTNTESITIDLNPSGTGEHITSLPIKEGVIRTISSVISNNRDYQKVTIPDSKVDTSTIKVTVQNSISDTTGITNTWSSSTSLASITGGSRAYFIEQDYTGNYSVNFGDGVIGTTLASGNLVTVSYLSTNGPATNGVGRNDATSSVNSFTYLSGNTVDTISPASGGGFPQSVESIRKVAPKTYASQNRAITASDFEAIVENNFSGFTSVFAYGGEQLSPPQYGKVFVSLKPRVNQVITESLKNEVTSFLKTKCSLGVEPILQSPDLIRVQVITNYTYNANATPLNDASLSELLVSLINNYVEVNTIDFKSTVSKTLLEKSILDTETSLTSLNTTFRLEKRAEFLPQKTAYSFDFANAIFHPHDGHSSVVFSNDFTYYDPDTATNKIARVRDDGRGKLILFQLSNNIETVITNDFGSVDYDAGLVTFNLALLSAALTNAEIRVNAVSANSIISSSNNSVLISDPTSTRATSTPITFSVSQTVTPTTTTTVADTPAVSGGEASSGNGGGGGGGGGYGGY